MRGREFVSDSIDLLYYKLHKISLNRGESHIDYLEWLKNKKATINPKMLKYLKDWKRFELNNKSTPLNIMFAPHNTEEIRHAYKSKYNLKDENQVILLMITDSEKYHYLAVRKLSTLFKGVTSKHDGACFFINCLQPFRTKNKLEKHYNVCKNHEYCHEEMPEE